MSAAGDGLANYEDAIDFEAIEGEQKITVVDQAPFSTSTPYWREKARVCKIVASAGHDVYLNQLVADLHGRDAAKSGSAEYQRIRRFLNSNPNFFRVRTSNGFVSASPTLELLDLIKRGIIQNPDESGQYAGSREFCESVLQSVKQVNDKGEELLSDNLDEYLERINDLRLVLKSDDADPEYLTLPYKTRFNDPGRIKKQHAIMGKSLDKAGEMYENAALLTLTTDPKKFDSLWEMWSSINDSWNRFMSWIGNRKGGRPDYVKVLEATEKGYPHIHAIVFLPDDATTPNGMPWLESKQAISDYWNKYQGRIVDVQPLTFVEELGDEYGADDGWVRWQRDGDHGGDLGRGSGAGQTAGEYLGKYLSAIYGGIRGAAGLEDSGAGGGQIATDGGRDRPAGELEDAGKYADKAAAWKVAMYWATRRKIRTESRDLRQAVEEDMQDEDDEAKAELAEQIRANRYEFVGAYAYDEMPSHVRNGAVPVDSLMDSLREELEGVDAQVASDPEPERTKEQIIQRMPAAARPLFKDEPVGSGMLFEDDDRDDEHADRDEPEPEQDENSAAAFM